MNFHTIYEQSFDYVFNALVRLGVSRAEAEDLSHEVFLTAYKRLPTYDSSRPMNPWLFGIAFRIVADFKKSARARREVLVKPADVPSEEVGGEAALMHRQRQEVVLRALNGLSDELRALFIMCEIEGHTVSEASTSLEIPLNTAYSRLRVARNDFAAAIRREALLRGEA